MKVTIPGTTLQRDTKSMALLQSDKRAVDDYNVKKKILQETRSNQTVINTMKEEISSLKSDLEEIKQLLKGLSK